MKVIVVSGGFDPLHSGHISYFKDASEYGDRLIVALNSDDWLKRKKGKYFMPFLERKSIIENLRNVDEVIDFEDDETGSATNALIKVKEIYPNDDIAFANGGDRSTDNIPEFGDGLFYDDVEFVFGVGGEDKNGVFINSQFFKQCPGFTHIVIHIGDHPKE